MNLKSLRKKSVIELGTSVPILLLAVGIPFMCWFGVLKGNGDVSSWFQRSGSIMVLFAVWAEFKLFKLGAILNPRSDDGQTWEDLDHADILHKEFAVYLATFKIIAAMLAITGTLICGYGDLLHKHLY
ncbi:MULTISPECIES: hypothetical protein [Vibrio]|nr:MULTISPECIES: hypothetical protein [Vibrio]OEE56550.1 hypothetical protein A146_02260 [Vibrio splendidus FF-500]PMJ39062.1 hypothetical protein BCU24_02930 [Vibrio cyclitrophicus]